MSQHYAGVVLAHSQAGRNHYLHGPAGDRGVPVVIATVLFQTLVGPLSNYVPSVAFCHIVGGVCWIQDDRPATERDDASRLEATG